MLINFEIVLSLFLIENLTNMEYPSIAGGHEYLINEVNLMNYHSPGVLEHSKIYLYNASARSHRIFYYLLCTGHYYCTSEYTVSRQRYDSFLLIYTLSGEGSVLSNGLMRKVVPGTIVFIDCYQAHTYQASSQGWEILWMHLDGIALRNWFATLSERGEPLVLALPSPYVVERNLRQIFELFDHHERINEARVSQFITNILTELYVFYHTSEVSDSVDSIEEVLTYISMHIDQAITVGDLAKRANLSPYYFSRVFKRSTGLSPYDYILSHRMENAKYLLRTTSFPVKKIALCCGFSAVSSFCTNFKKRVGFSPLQYREGRLE